MDVEHKLAQYERKIEQLEEQVGYLASMLHTLHFCKMSNSKYPYWELLIEMQIPQVKKIMLETVMMAFSTRLKGKEIALLFRKTLPIAGIDFERLYGNSRPHYPEVSDTLMKILEHPHDYHVRAMLKAMYQQRMKADLCRHLLDEIGEDPNGELYPEE